MPKPKEYKFTRQEKIDMEVRRLAHRLKGECAALFQLPLKVYSQIIIDNQMRGEPYRISFKRVERIVHEIADELK